MKISIITINYNNAAGLEKTIKSVVSQTYSDFEYIVIDGNSSDGSKQIIEKYKSSISYCVSEPDTGIFNAMNKGIKKASGDFCLFLNSGDWLFSQDSLQKTSHFLKNLDTIYYCDVQFEKDNVLTDSYSYKNKLTPYYFASTYTVNHQNTLIPRKLFDKIGVYREDNKFYSDCRFFIEASLRKDVYFEKMKSIIMSVYDISGFSSQNRGTKELNDEMHKNLKEIFGKHYNKIELLFLLKKNYSANKSFFNKIVLLLYKTYFYFAINALKGRI